MTDDTRTPIATKERSRRSFERAAGEAALGGALIAAAAGTWLAPVGGIVLALYGAVAGAALGSLVGLVVHALTSGRSRRSSATPQGAKMAQDAHTRPVSHA